MLYAISPAVIGYATAMWSPAVVPFFSLLALYSWIKYLNDKNFKWIILGVVTTSLVLHLHFQAILLAPFVLIVLAFSLWRDSKLVAKFWMIGVIISLIIAMPYILAELTSDLSNTRSIIGFMDSEHRYYYDRVTKPNFVFTFLPGFFQRIMINSEMTYLVFGRIVLFIGGISLLIMSWRNSKYRWLAVYLAILILMLRAYKGDKHDYYMSVLFVAPAILLGATYDVFKNHALILIIPIAFYAGLNLSKIPGNNSLGLLKESVVWVEQNIDTNDVNLYFHHEDLANVYLYGFHQFTGVKIEPESTTWVDICHRRNKCVYYGIPYSVDSKVYSKASWEKYTLDYTFNDSKIFGDHQLAIGSIKVD